MKRVTGRDEAAAWIEEAQRRAPWNYGASFDLNAIPPTLRILADRIASCGDFDLGKREPIHSDNSTPFHFSLFPPHSPLPGALRDVTINLRDHYFFRLDPHKDPVNDGANVRRVAARVDKRK